MSEINKGTEQKIMEAAQDVFLQKGLDGARMQEIADEAGINKALLHYYYRTKEKLFYAVFKWAASQFLPQVSSIMYDKNIGLFEKIRLFVKEYTKILYSRPFLPLFILHEITKNPDGMIEIIQSQGINPKILFEQIETEIKNGQIKPIDPRAMLINLLSLVVFPVAARPMMQRILFDNDAKAYKSFLDRRVEEVPDFIIHAIKLEDEH